MMGGPRCLLLLLLLCVPAAAVFGDLYTWGRGAEGQLGLDNIDSQDFPTPVNSIRDKQSYIVNAGSGSSMAVTADGEVYAWGQGINEEGVLVSDPDVITPYPVLVKGLSGSKIIQMVAGECHYAALTSKGEVLTWGCNTRGALGRGKVCDDCHSAVPTVIPSLKGRNVRQVVAGGHHVAVVTDNGEVWVWGSGRDGEIGNEAFQDQPQPVKVKALSNMRICQICTGPDHVAAVDTEGNLFTWGRNEYGQLGFGLNELRSATPRKVNKFVAPDATAIVSCGRSFTGVITRSNKVFMWGQGGYSLPTEKVFFSDEDIYPRAITAGQNHAVVLTKDYKVYTWGTNNQGQLGVSHDRFFTLDPQLVEELSNKHITMIVTGLNHTIALSSRPAPMLCPAFSDWYGSPDSDDHLFEAECHIDDETCDDGTCCTTGTSCTQFASGSYGCCSGSDMMFCEDQVTCCPQGATCNMDTRSCQRPVSYAQASAVFQKLEKGGLVSLGSTLAKPGTIVDGSYVSPLPVGTPINIVGDNDPHTVVGKSAGEAYSQGGLSSAEAASVGEYVKATQAYANEQFKQQQAELNVKAQQDEMDRLKAQESAPASVEAMQDPKPAVETIVKQTEVEEVLATPEDAEMMMKLKSELADVDDPDNVEKKLSRSELIFKIREHEELTDAQQRLLSDKQLRDIWYEIKDVLPTPAPTTARVEGHVINEEGVPSSGPFLEGIRAEEFKRAQEAPSIEDLEDEDDSVINVPVVDIDPTTTAAWKANVRLSENKAGRNSDSALDKLNVLNPPPAPEYPDGTIPGAAHLGSREGPPGISLSGVRIQASAMADNLTPRGGPCPRGAGNLECNQDCAETDNKVIASAIEANRLAEQAAADAATTAGAGREVLPPAALVSPSPMPSPSVSPSAVVIVNHTNTTTRIAFSNVTVYVNTTVVHVPEPGFYRDPETNITYRIDGDVVSIADPAATFASLGGKPGTAFRGHCGVSRPTCPDNSCCAAGETCCQQQDGAYGCCPFEEGSCCIDQKHCCPNGFTCDIINQVCSSEDLSFGMARFAKVDQGLCGDGNKACKDGSCCEGDKSCCQMFDGLQGCAPFTDATCCSDGKHACPDGSTCDVIHKVCVDVLTSMASPIGVLEVSKVPTDVELVCLSDELTCPDGACCGAESTCCLDEDGYETCCPFSDGVCCGVGSCCPHGTDCDTEAGTCVGTGQTSDWTNTITSRMPFMVSSACTAQENTCAGTQDCCPKGNSCCLGVKENNDGVLDMVQSCCPYGEDAVCCEDGSCCPFRHTCELGTCLDPAGNPYPKIDTVPSRKTDNPAASLCVDSKELHDTARDLIDQHAQGVTDLHRDQEIAEEEVTLMCPPFCGVPGSAVPTVDDGTWADESENGHLLSGPGEEGVHIPLAPALTEEMEKMRIREEMFDEIELLKFSLLHLLTHTDQLDVYSVRGSLLIPCPFNSSLVFRHGHGLQIKAALAGATQVNVEQVIIASVREGIELDYMIKPSPSTEHRAGLVADMLKSALVDGSVTNSMLDGGFPECGRNMAISELPGVQLDESLDLTSQVELMDHLTELLKMLGDGVEQGSMVISPELFADINSLRLLAGALRHIKQQLGLLDMELLSATDNVLDRMDQLVALLLAYLSPVDGDHSRAALMANKALQELSALFGNIAKAREQSKCSRPRGPNEQPAPGCESSQMPSTMRLRDADTEKFNGRLQESLGQVEFGNGVVPPIVERPPPYVPSYTDDDGHKPSFKMPEACHGDNCAKVEG